VSTARRRDALATPVSTSGLFNLPNVLTMLRLVLVVPFVIALMWDDGDSSTARILATVIFVVASVTDYIDGYLARQRNLVTTFGKVADPIADKLLTGAALVCLSLLGELPWWVTGLILFREIGVTLLRFWVINRGVIAASPGGKLKTALQIAAIVLYLLPLSGAAVTFAQVVMGAAVILTVLTGVDYLIRVLRMREEPAGE
jgi:CDP-diacylglycerol---glycerol-3-phosphate 3-phosphatidyltransferase